MRTHKTRILSVILSLALLLSLAIHTAAEVMPVSEAAKPVSGSAPDLTSDCKSAVLMEASTGKILYEQNPAEAMPPASVTKIMTLLLVME